VTKADFFTECLLVVLPVVTKDYLLKNDVSDDEDEKIVQAHVITDFSAQIASAAGMITQLKRNLSTVKAKRTDTNFMHLLLVLRIPKIEGQSLGILNFFRNLARSYPAASTPRAHLRFVKLFAGLLLFFMEERAACCGR
jgi:hypothetical protein